MANFYYLLHDHTEEVEELLAVMHMRRLEEYDILTRRTPAEAIIPVENTSSTLISPAVCERYSLRQLRDYIEVAHRHGKKVVVHMCGLIKNLLPAIRRTGLDGYNAMPPPTTGDTTFEHALDVLGEDVVILGGFLNGNVFQRLGVTKDKIWRELDALYTPRIRRAYLVLCLQATASPPRSTVSWPFVIGWRSMGRCDSPVDLSAIPGQSTIGRFGGCLRAAFSFREGPLGGLPNRRCADSPIHWC